MKNSKLAEYIDIAKGKDRTMSEYANAAGVNLSTISRIKSGDYKPGVKILKKLTSEEAQPRGGIHFGMLYEALMLSNPLLATMPFGPILLETRAAISEVKERKENEKVRESSEEKLEEKEDEHSLERSKWTKYSRECRKFSAVATGIIYNAVVSKGIHFHSAKIEEQEPLWYEGEVLLELEEQQISKWFFRFATLNKDDRSFDKYVKEMALKQISNLVFLSEDNTRKVSIVVNENELYQYLLEYKDKLSYRGNLSIIWVDADEVMIWKEEYLSVYGDKDVEDLIKLI